MHVSNAVMAALVERGLVFSGVQVPCCTGRSVSECVCGEQSAERVLRAHADGAELPPMTNEQRQFCYAEIDGVEGYERADYVGATDKQLANGVLCAWMDSARDKGMC